MAGAAAMSLGQLIATAGSLVRLGPPEDNCFWRVWRIAATGAVCSAQETVLNCNLDISDIFILFAMPKYCLVARLPSQTRSRTCRWTRRFALGSLFEYLRFLAAQDANTPKSQPMAWNTLCNVALLVAAGFPVRYFCNPGAMTIDQSGSASLQRSLLGETAADRCSI
jgi:hypothetical protein